MRRSAWSANLTRISGSAPRSGRGHAPTADRWEPGGPVPSYDKQYVRDWLDGIRWNRTPPGPELPDDVVDGTRRRYIEAYERITRRGFDDYLRETGAKEPA